MVPARVPAFPRRWGALVAVGGGLTGVLAFPRFGFWPAAIVSVALLSVAVDGRSSRTGAWIGYLYGAAFMLPLVQWTGIYVGPVPWLLLALAEAVFFALLGAFLPLLTRLPGGPFWVGTAWVLQEYLRDRIPFGGFPWGRLAFSQAESPLRWFAALGGAPLVTFAVAVAGGGLALAVRALVPGRSDSRRCGLLLGVAVAVLIPLLGLTLSWPLNPSPDGAGHTERIAVIQGGLPDLGLGFESRAEQVLDNHVTQTLKLAREVDAGTVPRPDLVLWPENSSDDDPFQVPTAYAKIQRAVKAIDTPVLVGAILQGPGPTHRRNVGILWSPTTGPGARYTKRHPVPFAEYIPLRSIAEKISSEVDTVTQDVVAGHTDGLLRGGPVPIGDVICFEVAYDSLIHSSVAAGARLLVVQTNNATFGHTPETYQQLAMSQLRAVETGRTVIQVATTGKSAVIDPDGVIVDESGPLFGADILTDTVPVRTVQTLSTRLGGAPEDVLAALAVLGVLTGIVLGRRTRTSAAGGNEAQEEMVRT